MLGNDATDMPKDGGCAVVIPVMNHTLDQIQVRTVGHRDEEVSRPYFAAVRHPRRAERVMRLCLTALGVEQYPSQRRVSAQHGGEQRAVTATDVGDSVKPRKVIAAGQLLGRERGSLSHRRVELFGELRIRREILK